MTALVTASDTALLAFVALAAIVPFAAVVIVALLRSYTISLHMKREIPRRDRRSE